MLGLNDDRIRRACNMGIAVKSSNVDHWDGWSFEAVRVGDSDALAIVDCDGLDRLTMRALGQQRKDWTSCAPEARSRRWTDASATHDQWRGSSAASSSTVARWSSVTANAWRSSPANFGHDEWNVMAAKINELG